MYCRCILWICHRFLVMHLFLFFRLHWSQLYPIHTVDVIKFNNSLYGLDVDAQPSNILSEFSILTRWINWRIFLLIDTLGVLSFACLDLDQVIFVRSWCCIILTKRKLKKKHDEYFKSFSNCYHRSAGMNVAMYCECPTFKHI